MTDPQPDGPLSPEELTQLWSLLKRYCTHDLDQWLNLKVTQPPPYGPIFVNINRALPAEVVEGTFWNGTI